MSNGFFSELEPSSSLEHEWVINTDHISFWTGKGQTCRIAFSNGVLVEVDAPDTVLEVLTGTSPHILGATVSLSATTKDQPR